MKQWENERKRQYERLKKDSMRLLIWKQKLFHMHVRLIKVMLNLCVADRVKKYEIILFLQFPHPPKSTCVCLALIKSKHFENNPSSGALFAIANKSVRQYFNFELKANKYV